VIENVFVGFGGLPFNLHNQSILDLRPSWVYQGSDKSLLDFTGQTHTLSFGCALRTLPLPIAEQTIFLPESYFS
jgi:hypothetical protein